MGTSYQNKQFSLVAGVVIGVGISVVVALAIAAGVAGLVLNERLAEESMQIAALGILFLSGFTGSVIATKLIGGMPAIACGAVNLVLFLVLVGINMLFFDGQMGGIASNLLTLLASSGVSCLISLKKKKRKAVHRKIRSR